VKDGNVDLRGRRQAGSVAHRRGQQVSPFAERRRGCRIAAAAAEESVAIGIPRHVRALKHAVLGVVRERLENDLPAAEEQFIGRG
jgi:hypothetical protein